MRSRDRTAENSNAQMAASVSHLWQAEVRVAAHLLDLAALLRQLRSVGLLHLQEVAAKQRQRMDEDQ